MYINSVIFNKILLQAKEAHDLNMHKLANGLQLAMEDVQPSNKLINYSYNELNDDIYNGFWKMALNIVKYYDLDSVDVQKLDETVKVLAQIFVDNMEKAIDKECEIGPNENKVPGEE